MTELRTTILTWELARVPYALETLGLIPTFLSADDPRPAAEQINENYAHGGGWRPLRRWKLNVDTREAQFPGDPRIEAIAWTRLRDEHIFVFPHAWVAIVQADGSFEMGRID